ncbi:MAG: hypothetical protein JJE22_12030, partial [Bacteroidia bacterium]|nr:hypothetical protein [Bacteroidia bacterium]
MIPSLRKAFNENFTKEKYESFLTDLDKQHPGEIEFRVAETPVFVPKDFTQKMLDTCESVIDLIVDPKFKQLTQNAIPKNIEVPNENGHSDFIAFDFGICINESGVYEPQLVEMQGFPTLFAYQVLLDDVFHKHFSIPKDFSCYLNNYNRETYLQLFKEIVLGKQEPANVILLEIYPKKQKTRIDFYCTEEYLNIKTVSLTELIKEKKKLFYINDGKKTEVKRIYNRIIFDELQHQAPEVQELGKILFGDLDVEWCPHPNWFNRISKYTLPLIRHPYIPTTFFLNEIQQIPADLENYVLKPLFSFAGQGVVIDITAADIENIKDPENYILQRKVKYADAIITP